MVEPEPGRLTRAEVDARDRALIRRIRACGDDGRGLAERQRLLADLLAGYLDLAEALVRRHVRADVDGGVREDVLQSVLEQLVAFVVRRDGPVDSFRAVVINRTIWTCKELTGRRRLRGDEVPLELDVSTGDDTDGRIDAMVVEDFLRTLPERDRTLFTRRVLEGAPSREVAGELGMTVSAVDTQKHRLVARLRERLGDG